jgi:HAD superfamily hydrolase (TIGR01509 family)
VRTTRPLAFLVDAYGTLVYTDFRAHRDVLPTMAGIPADVMYTEFGRVGPALSTGQISMTDAIAQVLRAGGAPDRPELVRDIVDKLRELLLVSGRLFDDALPFLEDLRARGIAIAIVSNCDENTRDLLVKLGVAALADTMVLSCEVGVEKPAPRIYTDALSALGVTADDAMFVDDNASYCAGGVAQGIRTVQIVRGEGPGNDVGIPVVRSLADVAAML